MASPYFIFHRWHSTMKPNSHSHYHQLPATPQGFHVLSCNYLLSGNPTIEQKKCGNPTITQPSPPHIFFKQIISGTKTVSPWFLVQQISCANGKAELTPIHYKFNTSNLCQSLDTITITKLYSNQPFLNSFGDSITSFSIIRVCFLQFFHGIFSTVIPMCSNLNKHVLDL